MTLHDLGLIENFGPRRAPTKRALKRTVPGVRKVLRRKRNALWLWMTRDLAQSRAAGGKWYGRGRLTNLNGWYVALGGRALLVLEGEDAAP